MGGQQQVWSLDASQNLPVRAGVGRGDFTVKRLIYESPAFVHGDFYVVVSRGPGRTANEGLRLCLVCDRYCRS